MTYDLETIRTAVATVPADSLDVHKAVGVGQMLLIAARNGLLEDAAIGRDAAAEIARLRARVAELEAALVRANKPGWFYDANGNMDNAFFDVAEVVESVIERQCGPHKPSLIEVATAKPLPSIWVVARAYTEAEKDARDDDEPYDIQQFASMMEAEAALKGLAHDPR